MLKNLLFSTAVLATLSGAAQTVHIDPASSKLLWTATKMTGEHTGGVPFASGTIVTEGGKLTGGEVLMDMTGITCLDIENEGANVKLVGHLKGADFFDVEQHPKASFTIRSVEPITDAAPGKPNFRATGDLTIKGITKPNTFDVLFWTEGATTRAAATLSFDRGHYDIKYRSGTFFPEIGDKAISDQVSLTFDISAK